MRRTLVTILAALLAMSCSVPIAKAGWQDQGGKDLEALTLTVSPGGQARAALKFYPADNESTGLAVRMGGDQPTWVTVDPPDRIAKVDAGVAVPITVTAQAPPGTAPGTYKASVSLLTGAKTVTKLPITIMVQ